MVGLFQQVADVLGVLFLALSIIFRILGIG
jgi:hypothetical protein